MFTNHIKLNKKPKFLIYQILILCFIFSAYKSQAQKLDKKKKLGIQHVKVYYGEGQYAGWPANRGIWSWGDEIVVGFVLADHMNTNSLHSRDPSTARTKFSRSFDGGITWDIEDGYKSEKVVCSGDINKNDHITQLSYPIEDFTNPDFILTFLFCDKDIGPSYFYYSNNRGKKWKGAFRLQNLGTNGVATRTDYIIDGEQELSAFFTVAKRNGREGRVVHARTKDGGMNWEIISWIGPEPDGFDIMPSSVRLSKTDILTTIRTRTANGLDLISAYLSEDNGETWNRLRDPVADTGRGGSPPALLRLENGRLALAYIYRSEHGSRVNIRFSNDEGQTWSDEIILRGGDGASRDVGYPRMVQREDGKLVIVYYWNNALLEGSTPYRYIAATIVDPGNF